MTALIVAASGAAPLSERIPKNSTPGAIFTACVVAALILWMFRVWYLHYGPGKKPDELENFGG
jgi:hypothetical protein